MDLTRKTDKLMAFSGIAQRMQRVLNDEYLAGLWKQHLPYHLLWSKRKDNPIAPEPRDYRAPSWSWASVDGKVTLYPITDTQTEEISVEILEAKTFSIVGGEMSQLTHGHINLRGTLRPAHMAQFRPDYSTRLSLEPDGKPTTSINVWPDNLDNIFPATVKRLPVFCLPVHVWWNSDGDRCTEGLILSQTEGRHEAKFKRVGRFKISLADSEVLESFYKIPTEWLVDPSQSDICNGKNQHVLTIV